MDSRPIGIFDSGVGGLSILRELQKKLPKENYIFFADQKNVPYGEKTKGELIVLTSRIMDFFVAHGVKLVVAACNTATCYAIEELRAKYKVPIVGVVPAIKRAAENTKTRNIAIIATPATAKSPYVTDLIEKFAGGSMVFRIGCFGLENVVEAGNLDGEETVRLLGEYVSPLKEKNIDQLVLGCTHYPFLKEKIQAILGPAVTLVDSGEAVARRMETILKEQALENTLSDNGTIQFFTNKDADAFSRVASALLGQAIVGNYLAE